MSEDIGNLTWAHGTVLKNKTEKTCDNELNKALELYKKFRLLAGELNIVDNASVSKLVSLLNDYRKQVIPIFEARNNSGQENLRSTILEEFFQLLFKDLVYKQLDGKTDNLVLGKADSYVDLTFSPKSFVGMFENPKPYIHKKMQDFVMGISLTLSMSSDGTNMIPGEKIVVPVVAIECKTYIERNMLDSCAGTAHRLKSAMPYCMYIVASEYMKMDAANPELTDIDEVFILCKASNSERLNYAREDRDTHLIDAKLITDLFEMVNKHVNGLWWSPEDALSIGKVINRP